MRTRQIGAVLPSSDEFLHYSEASSRLDPKMAQRVLKAVIQCVRK